MTALLQTAESLDECCMRQPPDRHAEKRLVATLRIQTKALVKLLSVIQFDPPEGKAVPRCRRGAPRCYDPVRDQQLMAEWAEVRGKAGMTRKEFCAMKNISLRTFIRAQDRFRKHSGEPAGDPV